jgi:hypothetical protein
VLDAPTVSSSRADTGSLAWLRGIIIVNIGEQDVFLCGYHSAADSSSIASYFIRPIPLN